MRFSSVAAAAALVAGLSGLAQADVGDVYMYDNRGTSEFFRISLSDPTNRVFINNAQTYQTFAMDFDETASTLYAQNVQTGQLGIIGLNDGAFSPIAPITGLVAADAITGITIAPNGSAYLSSGTNLYSLNLGTGACTLIGGMTGATLVIDIAADAAGRLYGHDIGLDALLSIDPTTGAATVIGTHGLAANFAQGMDFDWSTNTLYATIYTGGGTGQFVSWDTTTGAVTTIVDTGAAGWNMEMEMSVRSLVPAPGAAGVLAGMGLLALRRRR